MSRPWPPSMTRTDARTVVNGHRSICVTGWSRPKIVTRSIHFGINIKILHSYIINSFYRYVIRKTVYTCMYAISSLFKFHENAIFNILFDKLIFFCQEIRLIQNSTTKIKFEKVWNIENIWCNLKFNLIK